jgi:hypothetical protein
MGHQAWLPHQPSSKAWSAVLARSALRQVNRASQDRRIRADSADAVQYSRLQTTLAWVRCLPDWQGVAPIPMPPHAIRNRGHFFRARHRRNTPQNLIAATLRPLDRQEGPVVVCTVGMWMGAAMGDYREKAEECLRTAEKMRNPAGRIEMLSIARDYMALAAHADRSRFNSAQQEGPRD